ncbi:MAG: hypothetical protein ACFCVC_13960 [Acidimicrobiia bacterium]
MSTNATAAGSTTGAGSTPDTPAGSESAPVTEATPNPSLGIERLLDLAGIGFQLVHEGPGSCCHDCPSGLDLAA